MTADPRKSAPAPEADESVGDDAAGALESELDEARRRADEYLNDLRRVAADFDNYRKRVARDSEAQVQRASESIVSELLPVLDNLERAVDASEHHEEAQVAEGVARVRQQLADILHRRGLEEIEAAPGEPFDPHVHEALSHQPSEHPEGVIAAVWQRGYRLGDRIVRAARVVVSSGPATGGGRGVAGGGLLRDARRPQGRERRRDQEGLPQARPPLPPRRQPRRRRGGGALQGDRRGARHALRSRPAQAVRQLRAHVPAGPGPGAGRRLPGLRLRRRRRRLRPRRPLRRPLQPRRPRAARPPAPAAAATSRLRSACRSRTPCAASP